MAATVFEFEGTRRFAHPGWVETLTRVREDYGEWRPATNTDGEAIRKWLGAHGYRVLSYGGRAHDGSSYRSWWGLVSVFGEPVLNEHGTGIVHMPVTEILTRYEQHLAEHQPKEEQPSASEHMLQQLARARAYEACVYAHKHPELSAREVNEYMKARACGNV